MSLTLIIILIFIIIVLYYLLKGEQKEKIKIKFKKDSMAIKHGQKIEQFIPFLKNFKYNKKDCHFLGNPIDWIIFCEDKIIIGEVKTGNSKLTEKQKRIKELIENGKVYWEEFEIK